MPRPHRGGITDIRDHPPFRLVSRIGWRHLSTGGRRERPAARAAANPAGRSGVMSEDEHTPGPGSGAVPESAAEPTALFPPIQRTAPASRTKAAPPPHPGVSLIDVAVGAGSLAVRAGVPVVRAAGHLSSGIFARTRRMVAPAVDPALDLAVWATQTLAEVGSLERSRAKAGVRRLFRLGAGDQTAPVSAEPDGPNGPDGSNALAEPAGGWPKGKGTGLTIGCGAADGSGPDVGSERADGYEQ